MVGFAAAVGLATKSFLNKKNKDDDEDEMIIIHLFQMIYC